jgi:hypothetical protein
MIESILKNCLITRAFGYQAASQTDVETATEIDMASPTEGTFESVCFVASFTTVTSGSVITLKALAGNVAGLASGQAYATTTATVTASGTNTNDNVVILDVVRPGKRYIRPDLVIDTQNAALDSIIAIRYNAKSVPTQVLSTIAANAVSVGMA